MTGPVSVLFPATIVPCCPPSLTVAGPIGTRVVEQIDKARVKNRTRLRETGGEG